jgi:polar amino acid transport system substrate-binding protein
MKLFLNILGRVTLSLCLLAFAGCGGSDDGPEALVVGMELTYPPFEMRGPDNQPDGISVRMAEDLAESLGRPLKIEDISFDGISAALQVGTIDLIISSMTKTPKRAEAINFSDGYVTNALCMLVGKDSEIESWEDLQESGRTIAVKLSTTGQLWAEAELEGVELTILDEASNCVLEVAQGRADAFIYDQISIYRYWRENEETTRAILEPIRDETWGIGVRKGDDELLQQVNAFLKDYRESGRFNELADRYMKAERDEFERRGVPFIFH